MPPRCCRAGVKLIAFKPFTSAANALEQINAVSESQVGVHTQPCCGSKENVVHSETGAAVALEQSNAVTQPQAGCGSIGMCAHHPA